MTKTFKPRVNDVIIIETRKSSTSIDLKVTNYSTYEFAFAAKVDRKGVVQQYRKEEKAYPVMLDYNQRVITITDPDRQADARAVFASLAENFFLHVDEIRKLILVFGENKAA